MAHPCHLKSSSDRPAGRGSGDLSASAVPTARRLRKGCAGSLGGGRSRATTARSRPLPPRLTGAAPPPTFAPAMSRLEVRHTTTYRYAGPVHFGPHRVMLRPRDSHDLAALGAHGHAAAASAGCTTSSATRSPCSNFDAPAELASRAGSSSSGFRSTSPTTGSRRAERWPFVYDAEERRDLGPTLDRHYPDGDAARLGAATCWAGAICRR